MPVSSPSYFPPNRSNGSIIGITAGVTSLGARLFLAGQSAGANSTQPDLIVIGHEALSAGITNPAFAGSIAIGTSALDALTTPSNSGQAVSPCLVIGVNSAQSLVTGDSLIAIGNGIFPAYSGNVVSCNRNTFIGLNCLNAQVSASQIATSVIIGSYAASQNDFAALLNTVAIGDGVLLGASGSVSNVTAIGTSAAVGLNNAQDNVIIGTNAGAALATSSRNVMIGSSVNGGGTTVDNVSIGFSAGSSGDGCVLLGASAHAGNLANASFGICIGPFAGSLGAGVDHMFVVESYDGIAPRSILYGNLNTGNLITGRSTDGVDRSITLGTNVLKLLNGTIGDAGTRAGGGYFYLTAGGVLHWVNSAGTDVNLSGGGTFSGFGNPSASVGLTATNGTGTTAMRNNAAPSLSVAIIPTWTGAHTFTPGTIHTGGITVGTAAQIVSTNVALTNSAAAAAATLLNAPVAGNPTKWIGINDNGTLRQIPAW